MTADEDETKSVAVTSEQISPHRTEVGTDDGTFVVGADATPLETLQGSLAACLSSTGSYVAREMDIDIDRLEVSIEGAYDPDVFLGESDERAGFQGFDVEVTVEADADEGTLETWLEEVERRCPVSDTVQTATPVSISFVG